MSKIKNIFSKKTNKNEEPMFNLPIVNIENNMIEDSNNTYKMICKVSPINGKLATDDFLYEVTSGIQGAISCYEGRKGIYILSERVDINNNIININDRVQELDDEFSIDMLNYQKEHLMSMAGSIKNVLNFYFVIEKYDKDRDNARQSLEDIFLSVKSELEGVGMVVDQLDTEEIKELLYIKMNPQQSIKEPYRNDFGIENIYPQNAIRHKDGIHLEIENTFYRFFAITKYPQNVEQYRWLRKIFDINGNINIAIILNPKDPMKINKELSQAMKELEGKAELAKDESVRQDYIRQYQSAKAMIDKLGTANVGLYDTSIVISASDEDERKLEQLVNLLRTKISSSYLQSTELKRKDFDPFFTVLPILADNRITNNYVWNLTSDDVASIIPFDSSEYMEDKGVFIGENEISKGLVVVDYRNRIYNNAHMCVLADSGSGKTFFLKCDAMRNIPYVDYTIMFDIKGDLKFPFGKRYSFSTNSDVVVNPFHIRNTIIDSGNDKENSNVGVYLSQKIMDLIIFFKWINREMKADEESMLEEILRKTYEKCNLNSESVSLPKVFCTMEDMYNVIEDEINKSDDDFEKSILKSIRRYIRPYATGSYATIFNGQTNWDFDKFVVFDISNAPEQVSKPLYDILLKDTWQFAKKDGTENPTRKDIYVDECHEFADKNNPQTLSFLSTKLSKQGRGFGVRLITATQNIPDFLSIEKYGQAIIDNAYFKLFMRLGESDIPEVQKLYNFSDSELKIVKGNSSTKSKGTKGKGILMIGSQRVAIQTMASQFELEIIDPKRFEEVYKKSARDFNKLAKSWQ